MLTWRDIVTYLKLFLRWWYVLALAVIVATGTTWFFARRQPDLFVAQATLMVGNNFAVAAPNESAVKLSNVLASYYASMVKREVILAPVAEQLQLDFHWILIRDQMLNVWVDQGANLIVLSITDTDPERGAAIANAIADRLIAYTPNASRNAETQQAEIERQLREAQTNLQNVEAKIATLDQQLKTLSSAIDLSDLQKQLDALQKTRDKYLEDYSKLLALRNESLVNSLARFEQARPAPGPLPKKLALTLGTAAASGLMLAVLAVLVLNVFDERWRTGSELRQRTGLKALGEVPGSVPLTAATGSAHSARREQAVADFYANMISAARNGLPRSLLITSPQPHAARSALAFDLAELYVRTGHRVLLVDAETSRADLTALLETLPKLQINAVNQHEVNASAPQQYEIGLMRFIQPTAHPQIQLLSGWAVGYERFAELVPAVYWPDLLKHLYQAADVVIFDGPAALTGPDAMLLAPYVDGVLLALNGKLDVRSTVLKVVKQLTSQPTTHLLGGIVMTQLAAVRPSKQAVPTRVGGFGKVAIRVAASGITLSFGQVHTPVQAEGIRPEEPAAPLPAPEIMATPEAVCPQTAARDSWEDLLELEAGTERLKRPRPKQPPLTKTPPAPAK